MVLFISLMQFTIPEIIAINRQNPEKGLNALLSLAKPGTEPTEAMIIFAIDQLLVTMNVDPETSAKVIPWILALKN